MIKPLFDLSILPELSKATLREIAGRARALLAFGGGVDNPVESVNNYEWMISGIMRELQARGLNGAIPLSVVEAQKEYKNQFEPIAASTDKWLRSLLGPDAERVELLALSRLAAQCLADRIANRFHAPVVLTTMLRFYVQVPDAIEAGFPGYCGNDWIRLIITRRSK